MAKPKKGAPAPPGPPEPFHNPFGQLQARRDELPQGPEPASEERTLPPKGPARAVVRLERKGHGGKEVTVVEQLQLQRPQLDAWLKDLKQALGCGGTVEGLALLLQGDQRERLPGLLERRGVRRVTVG